MNPTRSRQGRGGRSTNRQHSHSQSRPQRRGKFQGGNSRRHSSGRANYYHGQRPAHKRGRGGRKMPTFDPTHFINKNPVDITEEIYTPKNSFDTFGLDVQLVKTVTQMGITIPTPIQDKIIPEILMGKDVIGVAETGTGKTAAFLVPLIEKTISGKNRQTLILAPTRELAIQIEKELRVLSRGMQIFSTVCVGGANIRPQIQSLRRVNHFVIGTPGRLLDLLNRGVFKPQLITTVVLDEADRMLDMGFINDIRKLLSSTPDNRETLLFSATMSNATKKLVHDFLHDPVIISVKKKDVIDSIAQDIVKYNHHNKFETLLNLLKRPEYKRVLVFGAMKHSVEKLAQKLTKYGVRSESIHGNKRHSQRQRALENFKKGRVHVLVATDVAARGIHVDDITHVINYDLPNTCEDYIHRIGRTGRATKKGKALSFVSAK